MSPLLKPEDSMLRKWSGVVRTGCTIFSVLLLLIIPLQMFAGSQALFDIRLSEVQALKQRRQVIYAISRLSSESEMRAYVQHLPDQPAIPPQLDIAFDVIKARVLDKLKTGDKMFEFNVKNLESSCIQRFLIEASRNSVHALLMAIAFSSSVPALPLCRLASIASQGFGNFFWKATGYGINLQAH